MFGISDPAIWLGYLLTFLSLIACIVYGIVNWNKGTATPPEIEKDLQWEQKDDEIKEML